MAKISIEVVYAEKYQQTIVCLALPEASTVQQAIEQSGFLERFSAIDLTKNKVGIFGKKYSLDKVLREFDRVEIYRPLLADPKEVRRNRAAKGLTMGKSKST